MKKWLIGSLGLLSLSLCVMPCAKVQQPVVAYEYEVGAHYADSTSVRVSEDAIGSLLSVVLKKNLAEDDGTTPSTLYVDSFVKAGITELNLSLYDLMGATTSQTYEDSSLFLSGLTYFNLSTIKKVNLSRSQLTKLDMTNFSTLTNLEELDLSNNAIEELQLGDYATTLTSLDLHNNKIASLDISKVTSDTITLNLSNNNIATLDHIVLPKATTTNVAVVLYNNCLDLTNPAISTDRITYVYGMQKLLTDHYTSESNIAYQPIVGYVPHIFSIAVQEDETVTETYLEALTGTEVWNSFRLPVANYRMKYYDVANAVYIEDTDVDTGLVPFDFTIVPTTPTYKIVFKGREYTEYKSTIVGRPTLKVGGGQGEIYYSVAGQEWKKLEGDTIRLAEQAGTYTVRLKNVENGIDSNIVVVNLTTSLNQFLPDIVMVVIIVGIMLILFFVGIPLLKKYIIR